MAFNLYDAIAAGLWATTAMTAFLTLALALEFIHIDFGRLLGGIFLPPSPQAAVLGLLIHFVVGMLFGIVYALLFALLGVEPVIWLAILLGLGFGIYHWVLSMPLISIGRSLNRHVKSGQDPDPGVWGIQYGPQEAAVRLLGHLIYGGTFGFAWSVTALLNGTAGGRSVAGNGASILLAAILAGVVIYLYAEWLCVPAIEAGYSFRSAQPSEDEQRDHARRELRRQFERGEISWEEFQQLRRKYAAEP